MIRKLQNCFKSGLDIRNKAYAALNIQKARAEEKGSIEEREMQMDSIMAEMVLDGIESDNLEMVMEAIKNGPEMSKEEKEAFKEENGGQEWDQELAKKGAKRALEIANQMKAIHYKNLNKGRNRNVDGNIVKAMTRIEFFNNKYSEMYDKTLEENKKLINEIKYDKRKSPSDGFKNIASIESEIIATERLVDSYEEEIEKIKDEDLKEAKSIIVKRHIKDIASLKKKHDKALKDYESSEITSEQKQADKEAKSVYNNSSADIIQGIAREKEINDAISSNNMQLAKLNDKAFQKQLIDKNRIDLINNSTDKNRLEEIKEGILNGDVVGFPSKKERENIVNVIDKRIAEIKRQEYLDKRKERQDLIKKESEELQIKKNKDSLTPDNNIKETVDDTESIEDHNRNEEVDFEKEVANSQTDSLDVKTSNGKSISLLDGDDVTSVKYREWINNGKNKVGTKITYKLAIRGAHKNAKSKSDLAVKGRKAIKDFDNAKKNGTKLPQSVYDNYPIQAFVEDNRLVWTFIPGHPGKNASKKKIDYYNEGYAKERRAIINEMFSGINPVTEIAHTAGGQLVTEVDENGIPAENNVKDLKQVKESGDTPHVVYSNIKGVLMEMDKKTVNEDFRGKVLSVGEDEKGNKMPYRGGMFLILNKADGTKFPVRLNFLRNTPEQAEVLADLIIDIAIPLEDKGSKKYKLSDPLNAIMKSDPELGKRIKDAMPAEIKFLKDPSIEDLINMFAYISPKTKGLTSQLYISDDKIFFSELKNNLNKENLDEKRSELIQFLLDKKRRQLNIKMWNDTTNFPGYRDFIFDNKIINTNVIVGKESPENEFQKGKYLDKNGKEKTRYVKAFAAPIKTSSASSPKKAVSATKNIAPKNTDSSQIIKDKEGPTELEINQEIKNAFPNKFYHFSYTENPDGTGNDFAGNKIPKEDMDVLKDIRKRMSGENNQAENLTQEIVSEIEKLKKEIKEIENMPISKIPNQAGPGERFQGGNDIYGRQLKRKKERLKELTGPFGEKESLAKSLGFTNWKHVLHSLNKQEKKSKGTQINKKRFENLTENEIKNIASKSKSVSEKQPEKQTGEVKEGLSEVFRDNKELSNIGTEQQYSDYLNSIFTDSKVNDILYHGTPEGFEDFDITKAGKRTKQSSKGIYFTESKKTAEFYAEGDVDFSDFESIEEYEAVKTSQVKAVLLNAINLKISDSIQGASAKGNEVIRTKERFSDVGLSQETDLAHQYVVFNTEQIHVLGSNKDIQGFKDFVNKPTQQASGVNYNFNSSNLSEEKRQKHKNFVLDKLGKPLSIEFESKNGDSFYKFTFKDGTYIETAARGGMLSYPKGVSNKIVKLSKKDTGYDIKFLVGLNKIAEEQLAKKDSGVEKLKRRRIAINKRRFQRF